MKAAIFTSFLGLLLLVVPVARAGDRPLEILLANMSPEGTRPDCMREIQRALRSDDVNIHRLGGERIRSLAGHAEDGRNFLAFTPAELAPAVAALRESIDTIVLVDCREEEHHAAIWLRTPSGGVVRFELNATLIDEDRAEWLGRAILMYAWTGFSP